MGGFMALHAAAISDSIAGVLAICPAGEADLLEGLRRGRLEMHVDRDALEPWLGEHDLRDAIELVGEKPVLLLHARGDEQIAYTWTEELASRAQDPIEAIVVPGGHHRSLQHDAELHEVALRWMEKRLGSDPVVRASAPAPNSPDARPGCSPSPPESPGRPHS